MRVLAGFLLLALTACFNLFKAPCEGRCADLSPSPNGKWVSCYPDGTCRECKEDRDCKTACGPDGTCLPCDADTPCDGHNACVEGVCRPCMESAECRVGETCVQGECGATCTQDEDCEAYYDLTFDSLHMSAGRGAWFGCTQRSLANFLCSGHGYYPDRFVCDPCLADVGGGACPGCTESGDCPCTGPEDCAPGSGCKSGICGHCTQDAQCRTDEVCGEGTCRPACTSDEACPGGRCAPVQGVCAQCLDDTDCPSGERCYRDGCVHPCTNDNVCFPTRCTDNGRCSLCDRPPPT